MSKAKYRYFKPRYTVKFGQAGYHLVKCDNIGVIEYVTGYKQYNGTFVNKDFPIEKGLPLCYFLTGDTCWIEIPYKQYMTRKKELTTLYKECDHAKT